MLWAGIVFGSVCLWVCLRVGVSVCRKSRKLLIRNRCNMIGVCSTLEVVRSWWHLTLSFDLELFSYFFSSYIFWMAWHSSFIVCLHIFRISMSQFSFKVMGLRSRSQQQKSGSVQLKNYWSEIAGAWLEYLLRYAWSNSELLTFWSWPVTFRHIFIFLSSSFKFWMH